MEERVYLCLRFQRESPLWWGGVAASGSLGVGAGSSEIPSSTTNTKNKQGEPRGSGMRLYTLKDRQWRTSLSNTAHPQTWPLTGDQLFKCLNWWETLLTQTMTSLYLVYVNDAHPSRKSSKQNNEGSGSQVALIKARIGG